MAVDWLPRKRAEQLAMAKNWHGIMVANIDAWNLSTNVLIPLNSMAETAETILAKANSAERTATVTAQCKEAFDALVAHMRDVKDRHFKSPPLLDSDFVSLGLKPKDTIKTPVAQPTGQAEADVTYPGPHLLMLHLKPLAGTVIDPRADYGYRIYYGILPHGGATAEEAAKTHRYLMRAAVTGEDLPSSQFTRRRRELFDFPAEDSGKTAYFSVRYENAKGQKGPWGPVFSAVVP
jgi:hypothetical protein